MLLALLPALLLAQTPGKISENIRCDKNAEYGYALYLPSNYTPDKAWPLLLAFDPRARGLNAVERFAPAAEKYGWIIAGSNNSRNGDGKSSLQSLREVSGDIFAKYKINDKRIYAGGMSGGARVATGLALSTGSFAGVIAASAAFPEGKSPKSAPFPIFGTAGTEDFNWSELYELDHELKSPHRVAIFEGGHIWLSADLATQAVEWFELAAMRQGLKEKDPVLTKALFEIRAKQAETQQGKQAWESTRNIAADFAGLDDRAPTFAERTKTLAKDKAVQAELKKERAEYTKEQQLIEDTLRSEQLLNDPLTHKAGIDELRGKLTKLSKQADAATDTADRRIARRITRGLVNRINSNPKRDPELARILDTLGLSRRPR